jgi:ABC-type branched-subunit amino acid transport system ATPase component
MLKIRDLYVRYGGIEAVQGVSLDIKRGSIVTLVGANGAGKSSIIRSIAGLNKNISGEISTSLSPSSASSPRRWCAGASRFRRKGAASCPI